MKRIRLIWSVLLGRPIISNVRFEGQVRVKATDNVSLCIFDTRAETFTLDLAGSEGRVLLDGRDI